ncbi:histidine phosphatase family protein [Paenibacillus sp. S150]|uniref:histidine phosphatase family protein n=1 Tax=Paenibacillus sp. S150 TaxID=2749826 RepID=UPI001C59A30D|nr:histidine phosphatase family protein [Paenibacillus sp. S150]MBW4081519.1 histidine phosphatase family protein [Paenibacillus sp. S150]
MTTFVYMVRHGDSPKTSGDERSRGLSAQGEKDARRVTERLRNEGIHALYSSPYARAADTIAGLSGVLGKEVRPVEDLKERRWTEDDRSLKDDELYPYLENMFADPDFVLQGGTESGRACKARAVLALQEILRKHLGGRIVIGTHAMVMALMMGHFADGYGFDFLMQTTKPDIYRMEITDGQLVHVERLLLNDDVQIP